MSSCANGACAPSPSIRVIPLDLAAVPAVRRISHLPVIVDAAHGTGRSYMVTPLARAPGSRRRGWVHGRSARRPDEALVRRGASPDPSGSREDGYERSRPFTSDRLGGHPASPRSRDGRDADVRQIPEPGSRMSASAEWPYGGRAARRPRTVAEQPLPGEEIRSVLPFGRQDRFGMKLDAVDREFSMLQSHDFAVVGLGGDFERIGKWTR